MEVNDNKCLYRVLALVYHFSTFFLFNKSARTTIFRVEIYTRVDSERMERQSIPTFEGTLSLRCSVKESRLFI